MLLIFHLCAVLTDRLISTKSPIKPSICRMLIKFTNEMIMTAFKGKIKQSLRIEDGCVNTF